MARRICVLALLAAVGTTTAFAGGEALWSYEGATGPDKWGDLSANWAVCGIGHYQSPIDIGSSVEAKLDPIESKLKATPLSYGLDGPTFAVPYESGNWITVNGTKYELQQFHFHHVSEHTLNGEHFPMEAHLVLKAEGSDHSNAVMGVFIAAGKENAMLNQFWGQLPRSKKKKIDPVKVNVGDLLPKDRKYFMYEGSMTTPGCPQGVRWFVLEKPIEASQEQIDTFVEDLTAGETNNRPVQPLYGRVILKGK